MSGLLRICTAGSVDDGKSTLIGRLLYDSRSVYEDQVSSVEKASKNRTAGPIDFSLFTDGLKAEREQGITIDVAYRYFATARRKFILADTPGHEQYTRNMATGASTADVAILLVDARNGVRDADAAARADRALLGITEFALAVNKMDLVDFDRQVFDDIVDDFEEILPNARVHAIPISALNGDNVITSSDRTPWFDGPSLLRISRDASKSTIRSSSKPFRFPVQLVVRPDQEFRGYAGQIARRRRSASAIRSRLALRPDAPASSASSRGTAISTLAHAPMSVTLVLDDEIDISRGDMITGTERGQRAKGRGQRHGLMPDWPSASVRSVGRKRFEADVVWMDERPLDPAPPVPAEARRRAR